MTTSSVDEPAGSLLPARPAMVRGTAGLRGAVADLLVDAGSGALAGATFAVLPPPVGAAARRTFGARSFRCAAGAFFAGPAGFFLGAVFLLELLSETGVFALEPGRFFSGIRTMLSPPTQGAKGATVPTGCSFRLQAEDSSRCARNEERLVAYSRHKE
jgi:hypothetical protein